MTLFLFLLVAASFAFWLFLKNRVDDLQSKLDRLGELNGFARERELSSLTARVYTLEQALTRTGTAPASVETAAPPPLVSVSALEPPPFPDAQPQSGPEVAPSFAAPVTHGPNLSERVRQKLGGQEWEALLGGSILNKLGALVLVVGIALFLAYSFTYMAPAGRAFISALLSLTLLGIGMWVERRQTYRIFSRGLIGAGWAGLYATAYAMYALPAAQVIANPFAGSLLLLVVAVGMIAHSLRYRAQAITSIAFFTAFAALAATPSTPFAVSALVPLAVALLYLAWRFEWYSMALFGLVTTWGACISRGASSAGLASTESLFLLYWIIFEGFDLLRLRRGNREKLLELILPINGIAFLGLSYGAWMSHNPAEIWKISGFAAALYLASALARIALGSRYEAALTVSAALGGLAVFRRAPGLWASAGIAVEAELLYLAGVRFRLRFMRLLGSLAFSCSLASVLDQRGPSSRHSDLLGLSLRDWTPPVLFHAFLFYVNRYAWQPNLRFSYAATFLLSLVCVAEVKNGYEGVALLPIALVLLELGCRKSLPEFRLQAYGLLLLSGLIVLATHFGQLSVHPLTSVWLSTVGMVLACWYTTARVLIAGTSLKASSEPALARDLTAVLGSAYALVTLWMLLPEPAVSIAWLMLALGWVELGLNRAVRTFRWLGYALVFMANLALYRFGLLHDSRLVWLGSGVPFLGGLYYLWLRLERIAPALPRRIAARAPLWLGAALAFTVAFTVTGTLWIAASWSLLSLLFLAAGVRLGNADFRVQSYIGIALVFLRCLTSNFVDGALATRPERIAASVAVIVILFGGQYVLRIWPCHRDREQIVFDQYAKQYVSVAAVLLLSGLLFHEVSGSLLTVAWGIEGLGLLSIGLAIRERILRLEGLVLLLTCILKLFVYDLRNLETVYRILSFIALGVILLGVSWTYTRFRERLKQYL